MVAYEYRCAECGAFEEHAPMGKASPSAVCPRCGRAGQRVYSAPMVYRTAKPLAAMLAREEASRDAPEVVHQVPPAGVRRPAAPRHPAQARLPRP